MDEVRSKSEHTLALARELLDDIELSQLSPESLLLKVTRLARLVDANESFRRWLEWEMRGYDPNDELALQWMDYLYRWTDRSQRRGYWGPLSEVEASIASARLRLQTLRIPDINASESIHSANPNQYVNARAMFEPSPGQAVMNAVTKITQEAALIASSINQLSAIRSRVLSTLHQFVANLYHEKVFSGLAENIFESYQNRIDTLLAGRCGDVLEKIPSINDRLAEGDREAISHALASCRRIMDSFADGVFPPTEGAIEIDGESVPLNAKNTRARIIAHIRNQTNSDSIRTKLRQSLNNLYGRVSAGVHDDVTIVEAQSLFVETYVLLGQVLDLAPAPLATSGEPALASPN